MKEKVNANFYYSASDDWTYNIYQSQGVWLRRALCGLIVMGLLLGLSLIANIMLLPLKEKVPYLYAFDHASGEITKIGELDRTRLSANWMLTRYLLTQYVIHHESYHSDNIDLPYQLVWAQSSDEVKKEFEEQVKSSNPHSPYKLYGKDQYIIVHVKSINLLNDNTVDIKFEKKLHDKITNTEKIIAKEAIIKWTYVDADTTQKMLERDPLGFKVTYYEVTQVNIDPKEL
jgi:type IV secretory pathway component VirB8